MREALGFLGLFLGLLLASFDASAGAFFRGYCYTDKTKAAQAFCLEAALPQPFGTLSADTLQPSATVGRDLYARAQGIVTAACSTISLGAGDLVTVTHSLNWRSQLVSQTVTSGTGYTYPAPLATASNYSFGGAAQTIANTLTFPACVADATPEEQVQAVLSLWPYALSAVATAWGFAFIRRRVVRWHEASDSA